jgi:hypothetical protein
VRTLKEWPMKSRKSIVFDNITEAMVIPKYGSRPPGFESLPLRQKEIKLPKGSFIFYTERGGENPQRMADEVTKVDCSRIISKEL